MRPVLPCWSCGPPCYELTAGSQPPDLPDASVRWVSRPTSPARWAPAAGAVGQRGTWECSSTCPTKCSQQRWKQRATGLRFACSLCDKTCCQVKESGSVPFALQGLYCELSHDGTIHYPVQYKETTNSSRQCFDHKTAAGESRAELEKRHVGYYKSNWASRTNIFMFKILLLSSVRFVENCLIFHL